jgi:hypothetical protein
MRNSVGRYALVLSSLVLCSGNVGAATKPTLDATIRDIIRQEVNAYHNQEEDALLKNIEYVWNTVVQNKTLTELSNEVGNEIMIESEGTGFVIGDKYITLEHVVSLEYLESPFGAMPLPEEMKISEKTYIDDIELIPIEVNGDTDVAIFQVPEELCKKYCNDGIIPTNTEQYIGMEVWWIGNPGLSGKTLREGLISRLDIPIDVIDDPEWKNVIGSIGLSTYVVPGDSGSPVFNKKGEIVGVIQASHSNIGYLKPIQFFTPYLQCNQE